MFEKFLMPLDRQYDDGFEVTATAFQDAAKQLLKGQEGNHAILNGNLPIDFLLRHSIELFLKSSIVTVHRALKLPTGEGPHTREPEIQIAGKWKPIHKTHSVKVIFDALVVMLTDNKATMESLSPASFDIDPELATWIDTIEASDSGSTYSRYPKSTSGKVDAEKSGFLPADPVAVFEEIEKDEPGRRKQFVLGMHDDDGNIVEMFAMNNNPLPQFRDALLKASDLLGGVAMGLNAELVHGFSKGFLARQAAEGVEEHDA